MSRLISPALRNLSVPQAPAAARPAAAERDPLADYLERVAKYIPIEIVGAFMAIRGFLPAHGKDGALPTALEVILFVGLVVLTPLYLRRVGGDVPDRAKQCALGTVSFVIWSYAIGGPFFWEALEAQTSYKIVYPGFAGALVVVWSLVAGLFRPTGMKG